MLEFDMPVPEGEYESVRYFKISKALEASGIPFNKKFSLDIEKGQIFEAFESIIRLEDFQKRFGIGCVMTPPSIIYSRSGKNKISYIRELYPHIKRDGMFISGVADMCKIAKALSDKGNYSETLSVYAKDVRTPATVFSDSEGWRFRLGGCEAAGDGLERKGIYLKDAVSLALDFYSQKTFK